MICGEAPGPAVRQPGLSFGSDIFFYPPWQYHNGPGKRQAQSSGLCLTKVSLPDGNVPTEQERHVFVVRLVSPGGVWPRHASTVPNQRDGVMINEIGRKTLFLVFVVVWFCFGRPTVTWGRQCGCN